MKAPLLNEKSGGKSKRLFPCPLCGEGQEVRESKRRKPYIVCNGCGVQLFVRTEPGIRRFEKLVAEAEARNIWARLNGLEQSYRKQCPRCGTKFWIREGLIETSMFNGRFVSYRCPEEDCGGTVKPEGK